MRYSRNHLPGRWAFAALVAAALLFLVSTAHPAAAAKPPSGRTYFTVFFGLDEPYDLGSDCFVFEDPGLCSIDGQICGSWQREDGAGQQAGFSFDLFFLEDGLPTTIEAQGRIDSRGNKSSLAGAGRLSQASRRFNFSFAGREVGMDRCLELLEDPPTGGDPTVVVGSGNLATEDREVGVFTGVVLSGVGSLRIRHTGTESLSITADDNLLTHLTSEVRNGRLVLGTDPSVRISTNNEILYDITLGELTEITTSGVAGVDARGIDTDLLTVDITGVAGVEPRGTADRQEVTISGVNTYDARNLSSRIVDIDITGVSRAIVRASDELNGSISGPSILEYIGNPTINVDVAPGSTVRRFGG